MKFLNLDLLNFGILLGSICTGVAAIVGMGINYVIRLIKT